MTRRRHFLFCAVLSGARRLRAVNAVSARLALSSLRALGQRTLHFYSSPLASQRHLFGRRCEQQLQPTLKSGNAEIKVQIGCVTNIFMQQPAAVYLLLPTIFQRILVGSIFDRSYVKSGFIKSFCSVFCAYNLCCRRQERTNIKRRQKSQV